jgi:glycine betaine/proline transport system ATP-binding protein
MIEQPIDSATDDEFEPAPDKSGIEISALFKIFGPDSAKYIKAVQAGMTKDELNRKHDHVLGLTDISLSIPPAKITVIMGLSGSGKSTLIRHINGLIAPTAGEIIYDGQDICRMNLAQLRNFRRRKTAMVFQKFALLPHRTVLENTCYGLDIQGVPRKTSEPVARHWIERVGLKGYELNYPSQLSGGMQQRVGLARALANDADILLMDEAFSALDPLIRMDMQSILLELQAELHKTIVFITHDLDEALRLGDKIAILRDGAMEQVGTGQDIVLHPANSYIASFVRDVNRGRVIRAQTLATPLAAGEAAPEFAVSGHLVLEKVARKMVRAGVDRARVLGRTGRLKGVIETPAILAAMVNPAIAEDDS